MKNLLLLIALLSTLNTNAQWLQLPDSNFRNALAYLMPTAIVGDSINTQDSSVAARTSLSIINQNLHNITGIIAFANLVNLEISHNYLQFLPTMPDSVKYISAANNQIDSIGLMPINLESIILDNNNLDSLKGAQNLPVNLNSLSLINCIIDTLPILPTNLKHLVLSSNNLLDSTFANNIPGNVNYLDISNCGLQYLDTLPSSIKTLIMIGNNFTTLQNIPDSVLYLDASNCGITSVAMLNNVLEHLIISNNAISSLSNLPNSLTNLIADNSQIATAIALPTNLQFLNFNNNLLSSLPTLPSSLHTLKIENNLFTNNFSLNSGLQNFYAAHNNISIPFIYPNSLLYLDISHSAYTNLGVLPSGINTVYASNNLIANVGAIPTTTTDLDVSFNLLTTLPIMPNTMNLLNCKNNNISTIASFPNNVAQLFISNNPITSYPSMPQLAQLIEASNCNFPTLAQFPQNLFSINISNTPSFTNLPNTLPLGLGSLNISNTIVQCLPYLPSNLHYLVTNSTINCLPNLPLGLNNGTATFTWYIDTLLQQPNNSQAVPYTICNASNSSCASYSRIAGKTFFDYNGNGLLDTNDFGMANIPMLLEPNNWTFGSNNSGNFFAYVSPDTFKLKTLATPNYFQSSTPDSLQIVINAMGISDTTNNFGFTPSVLVNDLVVYVTAYTPPRPGQTTAYDICFKNLGTTTLNSFISFTMDTKTSFVGTSNTNFTLAGNTITYNLGTLQPFATGNITLYLATATYAQMNDHIILNAIINPVLNDTAALNNFNTLIIDVVNSFDPNDKTANPKSITPEQIILNKDIEYLIRFQNTGNAEAIDIEVMDTLSTNLNLQSFNFISSSHNCTWNVDNHRVLHFVFKGINLPDSNHNELLSHGFVKFTIKANNNLLLGDEIQNTGFIYFDFNAPVVTNTAISRVERTLIINKISSLNIGIKPNPAKERIEITMPLAGNYFVKITNTLGEIVFSSNFYSISETLNISGFVDGIYYINAIAEDGKSVNGKFVVAPSR